jgi:membrane fusion protein
MEGSKGLFRPEVMDHKKLSWMGSTRVASPPSHVILVIGAVLLCLGIVTCLFLGHYARRSRVHGTLVPLNGVIDLAARAPSSVTKVYVSEGEKVKAGQPLIALSGERSNEALVDTGAMVTVQLREQQARLRSDIVQVQRLAASQSDGFALQQTMLRSQLAQFDGQVAIAKKQVESYKVLLEKIRPLAAKGVVSGLQIQQQQAQTLDAEGQVKSLVRQRFAAAQQLASVTEQLEQLPMTTVTKVNDLRRQLAQGQQSVLQNEAERLTVLRAQANGVVTSVEVKAGQAVSSSQVLLSMIPGDPTLRAELFVPSSAVGFLRPGLQVALRYQAFPYQKFGVSLGSVERVTHSALTPSEITVLTGERAPEEALYRVDVALPKQVVSAYGESRSLRAGMALDADLILERRRLIEWFLEPFYGLRARGQS